MSKFIKRLKKAKFNFDVALVVGDDFVPIEELLEEFNTVFVIADYPPKIKAKNLIFRNKNSSLEPLPAISAFFLEEKLNRKITDYTPVIIKSKPSLVIWNSNHLDREDIKPLLNHGYKRVSKEYEYHFWKYNK